MAAAVRVLDAQLVVDGFKVLVHRARGQAQDFGNITVGFAAGQPHQHFAFPGGQAQPVAEQDFLRRLVQFRQLQEQFLGAGPADEAELQLPPADGRRGEARRGAVAAAGKLAHPLHRLRRQLPGAAIGTEQAGGLGRGPEDLPTRIDPEEIAPGGIQCRPRALGQAGIGQMHADARHQFIGGNRLGDIIDPRRRQSPRRYVRSPTGRS